MRVRIKFQKFGMMKFIGHLDLMRYFQKAFRRSEIAIEYSKGFSPHQLMSFASPLGVGITSDGEYLDAELSESDAPSVMIDRLNAVMTEGVRVTEFTVLPELQEHEKKVTSMSMVAMADYKVSLKDGYDAPDGIASMEELEKKFLKFMAQETIVMNKKTKKSETEMDIKPLVPFAAFSKDEYEKKAQETWCENVVKPSYETCADTYENGLSLYLQVVTGSAINLKPELVIEAFCQYLGCDFNRFAWQIHRLEMYAMTEEKKLYPLNQLQEEKTVSNDKE